MKVIDVAMKYSFESHEGFSRSFKSLFGSSPKNIRNYLQKYEIPEFELFANCKAKSMEEGKMSLSDDMHKMIFTILGNSFEEMARGFCSKIELSLLPDNCIRIFDDYCRRVCWGHNYSGWSWGINHGRHLICSEFSDQIQGCSSDSEY